MKIVESISETRPSNKEIELFEKLIGTCLPEDYKNFLLLENGGRPEPSKFNDNSIHYFFALYEGRVGSLKRNYEMFSDRFPMGYLPIATDPFGNLILLIVKESGYGKIFFWDHEKEDEELKISNITPVANSFSEFIKSLT